jgi:hypothetical protein
MNGMSFSVLYRQGQIHERTYSIVYHQNKHHEPVLLRKGLKAAEKDGYNIKLDFDSCKAF